MQHAGLVLRDMRKAQNLTLRELSALCDVHPSMLSKNGKVAASPRTIAAICEALGRRLGGAA